MGYGCRILSEQVKPETKVFGFDHHEPYLAKARELYNGVFDDRQPCFEKLDLDALWQPVVQAKKPNVFIAFDVLEQLDYRELFLDSLTKLMPSDGTFLCSIAMPGKSVRTQRDDPVTHGKPWRLFYSTEVARSLLRRYFNGVYQVVDTMNFPYHEWLRKWAAKAAPINAELLGVNLFYCKGPKP